MAVTNPLPTTVTDPAAGPLAATGTAIKPAVPAAPVSPVPDTAMSMTAAPAPAASSVTGDFSVKDQLTGLLNQNSDYMKAAETKGMQYANQRGLLNSSIGATAGHAAAIDAALPIAQADSDWANKNRLQADTLANERLVKQYEQQNLAFSQYLKGMADVNMQDLPEEAKNIAAQRLWDAFQANSQIASTLAGAQITNGVVSWGDAAPTSATSGTSTTSSGTAIAPGSQAVTGETAAPGASAGLPASVGDMAPSGVSSEVTLNSMASNPGMIQSGDFGAIIPPTPEQIAQMAPREQWIYRFGRYEPAQVNGFLSATESLKSTYADAIGQPNAYNSYAYVHAIDGTPFLDKATADAYNKDLAYYGSQYGIDVNTFIPFVGLPYKGLF